MNYASIIGIFVKIIKKVSGQTDKIAGELSAFGMTRDQALIYLKLVELKVASPLKLSRELHFSRTRTYALLEQLITRGFAKEAVKGYGKKFAAENPAEFALKIREKELELARLKDSVPRLLTELQSMQLSASSPSRILHYEGKEGLKQVTWNSLAAKDVLRIYEIDLMHAFLDKDFSEKVRIEFGKHKNLKVDQLTNKPKFSDYTNITTHVDQWEPRYISKEKLNIIFEIMIYNEVICMYEYQDNNVFIVEIYNQKLADMQKQIFDLVWSQAVPMQKTSKFGSAEITR